MRETKNPYIVGSDQHTVWAAGYNAACRDVAFNAVTREGHPRLAGPDAPYKQNAYPHNSLADKLV